MEVVLLVIHDLSKEKQQLCCKAQETILNLSMRGHKKSRFEQREYCGLAQVTINDFGRGDAIKTSIGEWKRDHANTAKRCSFCNPAIA